ncbi:MAG: rhomboid family intramembrane serine protease [Bacteroidales bacterium]|nr:rhomboid family intramembrane serine protease [Bacteroidales bacterium]MDT8431530.1 rhomboid family intramembrane serine protease [Bacteroidales bacterium]
MTIILVVVISLVSVLAFRFRKQADRFVLLPQRVVHHREYFRVISHAFLHVDYVHLVVNMIVLFSFGTSVESIFRNLESHDVIRSPHLHLAILSFIGITGSSISTILKHRNDPDYAAVGASGLVSAIVFTHIFFQPMQKIYFYFAIPIPGLVFGILYLVYSSYMSRKQKDNINHDAHIWGAVIGFFYPVLMHPPLIRYFFENLGLT